MKYLLVFLLFFLSFKSYCQTRLEYGDFIQWDNKIEWACETDQYLDLTPKIPKYSIKNWYLKKLRDSGIITYKKNSDGFSVTKAFTQKQDIKNIASVDTLPAYLTYYAYGLPIDNIDTTSSFYKNLFNCLCDSCDNRNLIEWSK